MLSAHGCPRYPILGLLCKSCLRANRGGVKLWFWSRKDSWREKRGRWSVPTTGGWPSSRRNGTVYYLTLFSDFFVKSKLEINVFQIWTDSSTLKIPFARKRWNESSHLLFMWVSEPSYKGKCVVSYECWVIQSWCLDSHKVIVVAFTHLLFPFSVFVSLGAIETKNEVRFQPVCK